MRVLDGSGRCRQLILLQSLHRVSHLRSFLFAHLFESSELGTSCWPWSVVYSRHASLFFYQRWETFIFGIMGFVGTNVTNPINFSLCGTVLVVTGLRLLSRKFVVPPMGLDDVYISIAAVRYSDITLLVYLSNDWRLLAHLAFRHCICHCVTFWNHCLGDIKRCLYQSAGTAERCSDRVWMGLLLAGCVVDDIW